MKKLLLFCLTTLLLLLLVVGCSRKVNNSKGPVLFKSDKFDCSLVSLETSKDK
jgi:hypothetical protein